VVVVEIGVRATVENNLLFLNSPTQCVPPLLQPYMNRVRTVLVPEGQLPRPLMMADVTINVVNAILDKLQNKGNSEQDGADQPATAPQSDSEGEEKFKPESGVRPQ
jgi:hypothetical protein